MYDYWLRSHQDKLEFDEVFPSDELLDELHFHESTRRDRVSRALQELLEEFNQKLIDIGAIEVVLIGNFNVLELNRHCVSLSPSRTIKVDIRSQLAAGKKVSY